MPASPVVTHGRKPTLVLAERAPKCGAVLTKWEAMMLVTDSRNYNCEDCRAVD